MARNSVQFPSIITAVVVVVALYFARSVLIPIALAVLLAFVMAPVANWLQAHRFGRSAAVATVLFVAILSLGGLGWVLTDQVVNLATQVPKYEVTISDKIKSIGEVKQTGFGKAISAIRQLGEQLISTVEGTQPQERKLATKEQRLQSAPATNAQRPVAVEVVQRPDPLNLARTIFGPLLKPVIGFLITLVFTAFMLVRRQKLEERLFTLAGLNRFHLTKQAFDEATQRVGRYLYMLCIVNASYTVVITLALRLIGIPNALLWGVLAGLLRFIPYAGPVIATLLPTFFSVAVSPGWLQPILCMVTFIVVETIVGYFIEPFLYSGQTGISPLAFLVAAIFWAAVWGPIGLLLSTPMTVCLVVGGRYVPQLKFLSVLLGEHDVIGADVQLYQQLVNGDVESAKKVADYFVEQKSLEEFYDSVAIPVLTMIEAERNKSADEDWEHHVCQGLREIIEDFGHRFIIEGIPGTQPSQSPSEKPGFRHSIACLPGRSETDEVAAIMLSQLLIRAGHDAQWVMLEPESEMLDEAAEYDANAIYISVVPPFTASHLRRLYKHVQARFPRCRIGIGLWGIAGNTQALRDRLRIASSDTLITRLQDAARELSEITETVNR